MGTRFLLYCFVFVFCARGLGLPTQTAATQADARTAAFTQLANVATIEMSLPVELIGITSDYDRPANQRPKGYAIVHELRLTAPASNSNVASDDLYLGRKTLVFDLAMKVGFDTGEQREFSGKCYFAFNKSAGSWGFYRWDANENKLSTWCQFFESKTPFTVKRDTRIASVVVDIEATPTQTRAKLRTVQFERIYYPSKSILGRHSHVSPFSPQLDVVTREFPAPTKAARLFEVDAFEAAAGRTPKWVTRGDFFPPHPLVRYYETLGDRLANTCAGVIGAFSGFRPRILR